MYEMRIPEGLLYYMSGGALTCFLVWRVETLSELTSENSENSENSEASELSEHSDDFGEQLQRHCIDSKLYLQHDLTAADLARAVGTNHTYLSRYFSRQGLTYNAYINGLRIRHFVSLYREAVANRRNVTIQQLALDSGYRSYSTFSLAFRQRMGQSVTAWAKAFR